MFSDVCVTVSNNGRDEPSCLNVTSPTNPCKTLGYVLAAGHTVVCINGTLQNISQTIEITNYTYGDQQTPIVISCELCILQDSNITLSSSIAGPGHVSVINVTIKDSIIRVKNVYATFKNVIFEQVLIQDIEKVPNHVYFERSSLSCSDTRVCGLSILLSDVVKCVIINSFLNNFKIDQNVQDLMFSINDSVIIQPDIQLRVYSDAYLKIPSYIQFHNVTVNAANTIGPGRFSSLRRKRSTNLPASGAGIVLILTNPHFQIDRCIFHQTHIEIDAKRFQFEQVHFWGQITDSKFINGHHIGDGGALTIKSGVQHSKIIISSCVFINNTVVKSSGPLDGHGGAISINSDSLEVQLADSSFLNNHADNAGLHLYTSVGVTISLSNCSFQYDIDPSNPIHESLVFIAGTATMFQGSFQVINANPEVYVGPISMFYITTGNDLNIKTTCPRWYRHDVQYNPIPVKGAPITDLKYECIPCGDNYYTKSSTNNLLSYSINDNISMPNFQNRDETSDICTKSPYGAICTGNNVIPRPNYWGHWYEGELEFLQCPAGYCCSGGDSSTCNMYNYCAGNKTGTLCGACQEDFSVSILTGACTPDSQCGGDQWFWMFAFLSAMAYALWYTFKDDIFAFFFGIPTFMKNCCSRTKSKVNVIEVEPDPPSCSTGDINDNAFSTDNEQADEDKGYFGIVTYYVQMAAVIMIQIEFSDIDKSESFMDKMVKNIARFLNLELTQMSFDVCPIVGLTTLGKYLYSFIFLVGIYITWAVNFVPIWIGILLIQRKSKWHGKAEGLKSFQMKLIRGIVEIIKYTYAGFCGLTFMSLVCAKVGNNYVWWYDGTHVCLENWQIGVVVFAALYAFPFPFVLVFGLQLLKQNKISAATFCCCCLCPLVALSCIFIYKCVRPNSAASDPQPLPDSSETVISVLQGPYREDDQDMTLYWEAMVSLRRLLITGMTLVGYASIRMLIITILSLVFLLQHVYMKPFQVKTSNHVETFSLLLLSIAAVINLLKASLTDSGVIPSGPTVPFFKTIELCEKMFVLFIIGHIILIEINLRKRKKKTM